MNIYLPIEVKVRELEGKVLLALAAAEKGHIVIIGAKKDTLHLAKKGYLPSGIVHDKSLTPGDYKIENFSKLKQNGHFITAQDEETGLLDESFDHFAKRRFSERTISMADKIFAWGEHDAQSLRNIFPEFAQKIVATGSPRVDFWRSEFNTYYQNHDDDLKPDILIVSNFGYPIDENPFWNRIARLRKAGYFERDPEMEKYMYENSAYQYRLLFHFIKMIRALSEKFPDVQILVRPHPVEAEEAWEKLVGEIPNVTIERKGTISRVIRNTSVLIHNGCTSALEASVSEVPRIAYRPIPHDLEREIPNSTSLQAFTFEELSKMVCDILGNGESVNTEDIQLSTEDILNSRLASLAGSLAADKMVEEWEDFRSTLDNQASVRQFQDIRNEYTKKLRKGVFKRKLKRRAVDIRNFILGQTRKKNKGNLLKTKHKFPYLNHDEVTDIIENVQRSLDRFQSVSSVQFGQNSYIIFNRESKDENSL
ncbi:MAG: hypothetical protein RI575_16430 [Balneolaceae bacterium]|nr:hypothetical protein [Balneolaceae bacterium]